MATMKTPSHTQPKLENIVLSAVVSDQDVQRMIGEMYAELHVLLDDGRIIKHAHNMMLTFDHTCQ